MGGGSHVLGVRKEILQAIGKTQGDKIKPFLKRFLILTGRNTSTELRRPRKRKRDGDGGKGRLQCCRGM